MSQGGPELESALQKMSKTAEPLVRAEALAKLAELRLAQGRLEEAARQLGIKMSTARTQLASIFAKTDSQRQGKLIAILSRIAHMI